MLFRNPQWITKTWNRTDIPKIKKKKLYSPTPPPTITPTPKQYAVYRGRGIMKGSVKWSTYSHCKLNFSNSNPRLYPVGTWRWYNVASMSMQRHDVALTLRRRCINVMRPLGGIQSRELSHTVISHLIRSKGWIALKDRFYEKLINSRYHSVLHLSMWDASSLKKKKK